MVSPLWYLPSVVVLVAAAVWIAARGDGPADRPVARLARSLFGRFVSESEERERLVESAYIDETYRTYASRTLLYAALAGVAGAIGGAYLVAGLLVVFEPLVRLLAELPSAIRTTFGFSRRYRLVLSTRAWWGLVAGGGLVTGFALTAVSYVLRWKLPESDAEVRRRSIDEGMARTVAFMYALSRGGMEFPGIVRVLGRNDAVYGETAREMRVAVREMDLFGRDVITAIRRTGRRTPSEQLKTFTENLASVLQSGSSLPEFLREQYERFRQDAEERQAEVLELLATIAETYVTVFVAGVLFFITILLVFGLTTTDTLGFLQAMAYLLIPLANAGFALYLSQKLSVLGIDRGSGAGLLDERDVRTPSVPEPATDTRRPDGGATGDHRALETLALYDRVSRVRSALRRPLRTVTSNPTSVLYVAVPLAVAVFLLRLPRAFAATGVTLRILDDVVVQSVLLALVPYAVAREVYKRRIDRIEAAIPELLERLASLNEAGMTVTEGFERVRGGDLGVLTPEVERIHRDVTYGSNLGDALVRFGRRVRTTAITRVVTLMIHAVRASGQVGEVLRIAATQARADLRLRRQRRQQMLTYLVVIYVSFVVFLIIILSVNEVLVPSLPETVPQPGSGNGGRLGVGTDQFTRLGGVDKAGYTLVFFHTALVQAVCSGFVGGQLGEGSIRDGTKHAAIMLTVAYVLFLVVSAPVASVAAPGPEPGDDRVTVDSASLSAGGYVAVYAGGTDGTLLGRSAYLDPGTHEDVVVDLDRPVPGRGSIVLVAHRETTGDDTFDYTGPPYRPSTTQPDRPYTAFSGSGPEAVELDVGDRGG